MNRKDKAMNQSKGFVDDDLKTDDHDRIMIWLDGAVDNIISKKGGSAKITEKIWELPITTGSPGYSQKRIVGYVDMFVRYVQETRMESEEEVEQRMRRCENIDSLKFDDEKNRLLSTSPNPIKSQFVVLFEVKSRIKNIGEVIRQIRQYQQYLGGYDIHNQKYLIVSPDDRFKDILKSQGIGFMKVPDGVV